MPRKWPGVTNELSSQATCPQHHSATCPKHYCHVLYVPFVPLHCHLSRASKTRVPESLPRGVSLHAITCVQRIKDTCSKLSTTATCPKHSLSPTCPSITATCPHHDLTCAPVAGPQLRPSPRFPLSPASCCGCRVRPSLDTSHQLEPGFQSSASHLHLQLEMKLELKLQLELQQGMELQLEVCV